MSLSKQDNFRSEGPDRNMVMTRGKHARYKAEREK